MLWYPYSLIADGKKRHSRIWPKWVQLNMAWFSRSRDFNKGRFRPFAFQFEEISEILRIPNETVHSGCTDPNQATTLLVIVLVSRIPKQRYWGQQFWQMERVISGRPTEITRPVKVEHLQSWSRVFGSDQTEMVCSNWCTNRHFRNFELKGKRP